MKVAVIGITPVGCTVACLLDAAGEDVTLIGRPDKAAKVNEHGLTVRQVWDGGLIVSRVIATDILTSTPDVIVFAARTQDTYEAAVMAAPFVANATIVTIQAGTKTEQIVSKVLPRDNIITCVLTMGANCHTPGDVTLNFKGHMVVGRAYDAPEWREEQVYKLMSKAFATSIGKKIAHYNCTRLLFNVPYCIPAILGKKVQTAFSDIDISKVAVKLLDEGIGIVVASGVRIEPLPDFNEESLRAMLAAPLEHAAGLFRDLVFMMGKVPCEGPMLGSIEQGEPSEIDYQNGELVKIASVLGFPAPLNALMVELVHRVERTGKFLTKEEFLGLVNDVKA